MSDFSNGFALANRMRAHAEKIKSLEGKTMTPHRVKSLSQSFVLVRRQILEVMRQLDDLDTPNPERPDDSR